MSLVLTPGAVPLADWRRIYREGTAAVTLNPASAGPIAASAAAVTKILARGEPIYGINTGFGRLASIRIDDADLAQLQRNIVLSHAAGVGEPIARRHRSAHDDAEAREPRARASGISPATVALHARRCSTGIWYRSCRGRGRSGASGDLAPLAHMTATMIGVGEIILAV